MPSRSSHGETERGSTIYVRVSDEAMRRIDQAAKDATVSVNTWALRCFEECLKSRPAAE
jgi:predicted HicB family RNase H-like nuclease